MMTSKQVERFDIWLVYLYFTDHPTVGKVRPVLIADCKGNRIAAAKITGQPPKDGLAGEYAIIKWKEAGLKVPSTIRYSQVFELDANELLRDQPVGRLHQEDVSGTIKALSDTGFYGTYHQ